jgi:hypothetical protein
MKIMTEIPNKFKNVLAFIVLMTSDRNNELAKTSPQYLIEKFERYIGDPMLVLTNKVRKAKNKNDDKVWLDDWDASDAGFYIYKFVTLYPKYQTFANIDKYINFQYVNDNEAWQFGLHPLLNPYFKNYIESIGSNTWDNLNKKEIFKML